MFEIGNSLREARLRQHLDFPEAEHGTKIRGKYLRALEEERFEVLPSHTYVKGFLRSYADYLGLDGQLYVDEYNSRFVGGEDDMPMRARRVPAARGRRRERRESNIVLLALLAIALVTALVIAAWRYGGSDTQAVPGLSTSTSTRTTTRPAPTPTPVQTVPNGKATLELIARTGDSFVVVRRGGADGPVEYSGTIEQGQRQRFTGPVFWFQVRTPKHVLTRLNGNRVELPLAVKTNGLYASATRISATEPG